MVSDTEYAVRRMRDMRKEMENILSHAATNIENYERKTQRLTTSERKALHYWKGQRAATMRIFRVMRNGLGGSNAV